MTLTTTDYIAELNREISMRRQVYPGRVRSNKMTQAAADKKINLMQNVLALFTLAEQHGIQPDEISLPIKFTDAPSQTTTLQPHIHEVNLEIEWRIERYGTLRGAATKEHALYQLDIMRHILSILQRIQGAHIVSTTQTTLF